DQHWLILAVPQSQMQLGAMYATRYIGAVTLFVVLAVMATVALFGRPLTGPLARLAVAAGRVEQGDLHVTVPVDGNDEIGNVGRAFNQMVDSVRQGRRELADAARIAG